MVPIYYSNEKKFTILHVRSASCNTRKRGMFDLKELDDSLPCQLSVTDRGLERSHADDSRVTVLFDEEDMRK